MALEHESAFFDAHKDEWLQHYRGQYALVHGDKLLGTFTQFDEAFAAGVERLGNQPFLIRQVTDENQNIQYPALVVGMLGART
jgi:hypothetical protein